MLKDQKAKDDKNSSVLSCSISKSSAALSLSSANHRHLLCKRIRNLAKKKKIEIVLIFNPLLLVIVAGCMEVANFKFVLKIKVSNKKKSF